MPRDRSTSTTPEFTPGPVRPQDVRGDHPTTETATAPDPDSPDGLGDSGSPMPTVDAGTPRGPLDRRTILLAAVTLIDQNDLRHLTMRRLGAHLGVEGM